MLDPDAALLAAVRAAAWVNHPDPIPPDDLGARIVGPDPGHRVVLPGAAPTTWAVAAPLLDGGSARVVLPRPGDLRGSREDTAPILDGAGVAIAGRSARAAEAAEGAAWVWLDPHPGPDGTVSWDGRPGSAPVPAPDPDEADRMLRRALLDAANTLADLASLIPGPGSRDDLERRIEAAARAWTRGPWPAGWPAQRGELALRALRIHLSVGAAMDAGAGLTSGIDAERASMLAGLGAAARRALEASVAPVQSSAH